LIDSFVLTNNFKITHNLFLYATEPSQFTHIVTITHQSVKNSKWKTIHDSHTTITLQSTRTNLY
jgi:hypothetical protein